MKMGKIKKAAAGATLAVLGYLGYEIVSNDNFVYGIFGRPESSSIVGHSIDKILPPNMYGIVGGVLLSLAIPAALGIGGYLLYGHHEKKERGG